MKASGEVEHERVGEVYTTLVGLLKAKSEHFATTIAKQVCQKWVYSDVYIHLYVGELFFLVVRSYTCSGIEWVPGGFKVKPVPAFLE